jgi:hypothetical protein
MAEYTLTEEIIAILSAGLQWAVAEEPLATGDEQYALVESLASRMRSGEVAAEEVMAVVQGLVAVLFRAVAEAGDVDPLDLWSAAVRSITAVDD